MTELEVIMGYAEVKADDLCDVVDSGRAVDYADYKYMCGRIRAYLDIKSEIVNLMTRLEIED